GCRCTSWSGTCATSHSSLAGPRRPWAEEDGDHGGDRARSDPIRGHEGVPALPGPAVPEHRTRRRGLAHHHRRPADPRRQLGRLYHVERGETDRWRVISPAQAYHGSTMGTLALSGRRTLQEPYTPYLAEHLHLEPSTWRFDPTGEAALRQLDALLDEAGPGTIAAFFCEPVSAAALPGYSPPEAFWRGLDERRKDHGFLICFDEVVTGMGRVGTRLAAHPMP